MKVVAFVPVKANSSRVENKNVKLLDGKPLFLHTLEKLVECEFIDEVYLDTECDDIIEMASEVTCSVLKRDPKLASNTTDGHHLFMNEVEQVEADIYIQALCTSPFIEKETIENAVNKLKVENDLYDSVVLVKNEKQYTWSLNKPNYDFNNIPNSNDLESTVIETMGLYVVSKAAALQHRKRIGANPFMLEASPLEAIDVNWPADFELANLLAAGIREKDRKLLDNIKNHLSSSMLSDILDDFGFPNQIIKGLTPNFANVRVLGRAKTLKLRLLEDGEDFKGIYDALNSYDTIVPNDVIVVENEAPEFAYFGELNSNLAIRSGASGVIVNGMTRDSSAVCATGLPVFSKGTTCQDVRKRATTAHYNKAISLNGITVQPAQLIYADSEGVIAIPKEIEKDVLNEVFKRASNESGILAEISAGQSVKNLTDRYGFF